MILEDSFVHQSRSSSIKPNIVNRLMTTFWLIVLYRFATFITIPGVSHEVLSEIYAKHAKSFFMFNAISGGALSRISIMSLNLMPYISATIIMQLAVATSPALKELKRDPMQRKVINNYGRFLSLFISIIHGIGLCFMLESIPYVVIKPGLVFRLMTIMCVSTSSMIALWISERITSSGIGSGTSLITFLNVISSVTYPVIEFLVSIFNGKLACASLMHIVAFLLLAGSILFAFAFDISFYNIKVFFKKSTQKSVYLHNMPMKLNPVGILPAMFAESIIGPVSILLKNVIFPKLQSIFSFLAVCVNNNDVSRVCITKLKQLILFPFRFLGKSGANSDSSSISALIHSLICFCKNHSIASIGILCFKVMLLIFFAFFCLDFAMQPDDISYNLRSRDINVAGVREGNKTSQFFASMLNAISSLGAICLVMVCAIVPFILDSFGMSTSGTSIFIIIGVGNELLYKFRSMFI